MTNVLADSAFFPKLRWPIEIRKEHWEGESTLIFSCPLGVAPEPLLLKGAVAPIVACFEGALSIEQIAQQFSSYGVTSALVRKVADLLDANLFLATPRYFAAERALRDEFASSDTRRAALAGLGYSRDADRLRAELAEYLAHGTPTDVVRAQSMLGIVAPHIDYRRGKICYGKTFAHFPTRPVTCLLIGTSHQYSPRLFHLTAKDFETPLGTLRCERELVGQIAAAYGLERAFADEFLHRREHSLELQLPFLKLLSPESTIIPVLVGGFHEFVAEQREPTTSEEYLSFIEGLVDAARSTQTSERQLFILAGVDMAHLGRHFGDTESLSPDLLERVRERDKAYLDAICSGSKSALFSHVAEDQDLRRICGFPTMYTVLDLLERLSAKYTSTLFEYRQAVDYASDCAVTFAGMGLYRNLEASAER